MRPLTAVLSALLFAVPGGSQGQVPPAAVPPSFTIGDALRFVMVEGSVTPAARNVAEVTATFRVENTVQRPITVAAGAVRFRRDAEFPVTRIDGLRLCPPQGECRRAQATTFAPGSNNTIHLVARVTLSGANDRRAESLREMRSIDLYMEIIRFLAPGDPDYRERPPGFSSAFDQTFRTSMNFQHADGVMRNRMPGSRLAQ
jgi:hypothetical protein